MEITDEKASARDRFLDKLVMQLSKEVGEQLLFVSVIDEKARPMYSQKGESSFPLTPGRENVLGVHLALSFSMLKQIQSIFGNFSHIVITYDNHEVVMAEIVSNSIIYVICNKGSASAILNALIRLIEEVPAMASKQVD